MRSISDLVRKFGEPQRVLLPLPSVEFPPLSERRHGEVCMAILRRSGGFLLQTKKNYPNSVMRLPSGGIKAGEDIEHALMREIWEETNLDVHVERFLAVLGYRDVKDQTPFLTYLFFLREIGDWVEARPQELLDFADALKRMDTSWSNWGLFRAASLEVLAAYCKESDV
jgi:ADP-ribose pyrophosphatase YjhB (NUDIX family)